MTQSRCSAAPGAVPSILLVEDDELASRMLRDLLRSVGIEVIAVDDGVSAIAAFGGARPRPALAVIDLHLASHPGSEVGRSLRSWSPGLPLVYISGLAADDPEVREALGADAASRFLAKPFGVRELLEVIHGLVPSIPAT